MEIQLKTQIYYSDSHQQYDKELPTHARMHARTHVHTHTHTHTRMYTHTHTHTHTHHGISYCATAYLKPGSVAVPPMTSMFSLSSLRQSMEHCESKIIHYNNIIMLTTNWYS